MRLFLGLELPEPVKVDALSLRRPWPGARWQRPEQLHLTLHFLGEVACGELTRLCDALEAPPLSPCRLMLSGVGVFGSPDRPRVLWAGVDPEAPLHTWHRVLGERLAAQGFPLEARPYHPHLTLARFGGRPVSVDAFLQAHADFTSSPFDVDTLTLFASHLSSGGARYEVIERFPSPATFS